MKVLFAVSNEEISESIVKKYQKEYKQIISYKNVYYFNAILKELQKDKTYDRIVISEELEAFTNKQYDQIDKFIFEKLDGISDEASNVKGNDIPIILICSDRRTKSEDLLVKLFGIGIYNALIGNDRSVEEVCKLIKRPRLKKEAKTYYQIDTEDVKYEAENENDVSEMEIQNIVAYYKRLGKNEERYVDSFNNIAAQYNDTQLRMISKFLPLNVKAVLEEQSPKYQQIMSFNNSVSNNIRYTKEEQKKGPSETLLKPKNKERLMSKPVVIPSAVNMETTKKLSHKKPTDSVKPDMLNQARQEVKEETRQEVKEQEPIIDVEPINEVKEESVKEEVVVPAKRGRGRPRKNPIPEEQQVIEQKDEETILPGFDNLDQKEDTVLPGFDNVESKNEEKANTILPGFDNYHEEDDDGTLLPGFEEDKQEETLLPGFDNYQPQEKEQQKNISSYEQNSGEEINQESNYQGYNVNTKISRNDDYENTIDLSYLLTPEKKIVTFVGTSKNGTSFIVNNVAELMSSIGVSTVILDTTKNRNSYYIYTKNEEELRQTAAHSIEGLTQGVTRGINVNKNLTVYTSLPDENEYIYQVDNILETLLKNYSLILIDTDFDSPLGYFKQSQETYLVQTYDILTIQPLTAFLRELKAKNILDEKKLRIILNKTIRIRGVTDKTIIGGMSNYTDPAMSFMTELFDRTLIKYVSIPFDEEVYVRYLQGIIDCDVTLKGYSKQFMQTLKELGNMIYPVLNNKATYRPPSTNYGGGNGFSPNINNTLDQMKRRY